MPLNEDTLQRLIAQLGDAEPLKRWEAADTLSRTGDTRAVEPLLKALHDERESVRHAAARALSTLGAAAFPALVACLQQDDWRVREAAAIALGESGDERAIPLLIEALQDDAGEVVVQAAFGLGNFKDERVIAPLIQVLGQWDPSTETAARALSRQGEPALQPLLDALRNDDDKISASAAEALGYLGDKRAVDALIEALENPEIRPFVVEALGRIGDPRAVPPLEALREDPSWLVRRYVAEALESLTPP